VRLRDADSEIRLSRQSKYPSVHCLVFDGVYRTNAKGEPEFIEIPAPSDEDVWEVLQSTIKRVMKQLVRRGVLVEAPAPFSKSGR
jgi:hypothetical protein